MRMKNELFAELVASLREGGAILRDEAPAARTFSVLPVDIKQIRDDFGLTQDPGSLFQTRKGLDPFMGKCISIHIICRFLSNRLSPQHSLLSD